MRKTIKESTIRKIIRKELIRESENQGRLDDKLDTAFNQLNIDTGGESAALIEVVKKMTHLLLIAVDKNTFQGMTGETGSNISIISNDLSDLIKTLNETQVESVITAVRKLNMLISQHEASGSESQ